jgi:predicted  nucleic acid-binding Zn-ribbon protein
MNFDGARRARAARLTVSATPAGRDPMSTAGKVLVVLFLLTSLIWMVLASDVARYETNANEALHRLTGEVEKLEGQLDQTEHEIAGLLDQTSQTQEQVDREFTVLRARQTDVEKNRSDIQDTLAHVQYELTNVQDTVKTAQLALGHREEELQAENQALAAARTEVQTLVADTKQLMDRLTALRNDFKTTYQANLEMLGKFGRSHDVQGGRAH